MVAGGHARISSAAWTRLDFRRWGVLPWSLVDRSQQRKVWRPEQ